MKIVIDHIIALGICAHNRNIVYQEVRGLEACGAISCIIYIFGKTFALMQPEQNHTGLKAMFCTK